MRRFLLKLRRRRSLERDLQTELALHRELAAAHGDATPFGNTARLMEESRDLWRFGTVEDLWRDVRYAARALLASPGFTIYALLALVVGIGLNLAVLAGFTAATMRQPRGVGDPERLIRIDDRESPAPAYFSLQEYQQLSADMRIVSGIAIESSTTTVRNDRDQSVDLVSSNFFQLLGVRMALGRAFTADENRPDEPSAVVVMAHSLWQSEYGADSDIVGRQIMLRGVPFRVVGVADRAFDRGELWAPLAAVGLLDPDRAAEMAQGEFCCQLIARLSSGVTRRHAQAELDVLTSRLRSARQTRDATTTLGAVTLRDIGTGTGF